MSKGKKYSNELLNLIINKYKEGKSPYWMVNNIEELKNKKPSTIYGILKRNNVKTRRKIVLTQEQRKNRRKYSVNDNYFENINTDEKAYWLGFILADGWITDIEDRVGISISENDIEHLKAFKKAIQSKSPIKKYKCNGYGSGNYFVRIIISSQKMKKDLMKYGVQIQKTNILKFPYNIPKKFYYSLIRGYFDGDGCITYGGTQKCGNKDFNIKILGTYEFITSIQKILDVENLTLTKRHINSEANNYTLTIAGNIKVINVLNKLYKNSTICLKRKYNRYLELKQQQMSS